MLGRDLCAAAPEGVELVTPPSGELDVRSEASVRRALAVHEPDHVINAAAWTRVDDAEREEAAAARVNAEAPGILGAACAERGIRVVHFSTDYVFDGSADRPYREDDATGPLNAYGRTKLAGERALFDSGARALVIRTAWLFGEAGRSFPRTMLERARARRATRVVDDQRGRPTSTRDLAAATWELVATGATGVVHASNGGDPATWYAVARRIFERAGAGELLSPCTTAEFPAPAPRPRWSVLDTARLESLLGHGLRDWREALDEFLDAVEGAEVRA